MEEIVKHILQITNRDERGNVLAYKILCNMSINMVQQGSSAEEVIVFIDGLLIDLDQRKI